MAVDGVPAAPRHAFRRWPFAAERSYRLAPAALEWTGARSDERLPYREVERIRLYKVRKLGAGGQLSASRWRCAIHAGSGIVIVLAPDHLGRSGLEDRQHSFAPFVGEFIKRVAAANPGVRIERTQSRGSWWGDALVRAWIPSASWLARQLARERAGAIAARTLRAVGPLIPEHRIGRANLAAAFPAKSPREIDHLLGGVWDNLGRVGIEYAHLDRICEAGGRAGGSIVADAATIAHLEHHRRGGNPALFFCAHLANWELPALVARSQGVDVAVPVRTTHQPVIAEALAQARGGPGSYIAIDELAPARIKAAMDRGACIATMVDQHFPGGVDVGFFGRSCKAAPMLGRLARSLEWPIKGIRVVRLPDQRFRIDVVGPIAPPRDGEGRVDVAATMQTVTAIVEGWVREHPDQWLWLHRRWR